VLELSFRNEVWYWRGPAPFYFITVPEDQCRELKAVSAEVTYGWGMIPATVRIGATEWTTALFPKDGRYLVPIKGGVRTAEGLDDGDTVTVTLTVAMGRWR
jgi:hypothetical protein